MTSTFLRLFIRLPVESSKLSITIVTSLTVSGLVESVASSTKLQLNNSFSTITVLNILATVLTFTSKGTFTVPAGSQAFKATAAASCLGLNDETYARVSTVIVIIAIIFVFFVARKFRSLIFVIVCCKSYIYLSMIFPLLEQNTN